MQPPRVPYAWRPTLFADPQRRPGSLTNGAIRGKAKNAAQQTQSNEARHTSRNAAQTPGPPFRFLLAPTTASILPLLLSFAVVPRLHPPLSLSLPTLFCLGCFERGVPLHSRLHPTVLGVILFLVRRLEISIRPRVFQSQSVSTRPKVSFRPVHSVSPEVIHLGLKCFSLTRSFYSAWGSRLR